jgi:hypothetical protein
MKKKIMGTISFIVFPLFVGAAAYAQGITWTPANPMNKARAFFAAVELLNGNVLVAGGFDGSLNPPPHPPNPPHFPSSRTLKSTTGTRGSGRR